MVETFNPKQNIEQWEITTEGTCWVWVTDPRDPTGYKKQRVGGRAGGSRKLRISTDDRRFNQEQVVDEMKHSDPFTNGLLRKVDETQVEDIIATNHLTRDDLESILSIKDEDLFKETVRDITSELVLHRLSGLEKHAQVWQVEYLQDLLRERYGVGGTQQSIREQDTPGYRGISLSGY